MARFLGMNAFAPTAILRFQIRQRLKKLRNEDKEIMWEGIENLREEELRQDLRNRGLPTVRLSKDQMEETLSNWLALSQKKEIPYALLILTNMLHFAGTREEQKETGFPINAFGTSAPAAQPEMSDAEIDVVAAQAALSSLPMSVSDDSTLVSEVDKSNDEKLQALRREEELIEEERVVAESYVKPEELLHDDEELHPEVAAAKAAKAASGVASLSSLPISSEKKKSKKEKPEKLQLSHDQVGEIAEAVDRMASETPVKKERLEVDALEREREAHREEIEEGKKSSAQVAMLDSRVSAMLARLRSELGEAESQIGEAFHSLDLDGDGMHASKHTSSSLSHPPPHQPFLPPTHTTGIVTHDELLKAMEELNLSKRPDAAAFQELLDQIDIDADGKISVEDFRRLIREMQMRGEEEEEKPEPVAAAEKLLEEVGKIERAKEEAMKGTVTAFAETTGSGSSKKEKSA